MDNNEFKLEEFVFPIKREQIFEISLHNKFFEDNTIKNDGSFSFEDKFSYLINQNLSLFPENIFTNQTSFYYFYTIVNEFEEISQEEQENYSNFLLKCFSLLIKKIKSLLQSYNIRENQEHIRIIKTKYRNSIKIYIFIIEILIEKYYYQTVNSKQIKKNTRQMNKKKANQNKNEIKIKKVFTFPINDYLDNINTICNIHIENFFPSKIIEIELFDSIRKSLFNLLKSLSISQSQKNKIFLIISSIITEFKEYTEFKIFTQNLVTSFIELIYTHQNLINFISTFFAKFSLLFNDIVIELLNIIEKENSNEIQGLSNVSLFFISLCKSNTKIIYQSITLLLKMFKSNNYIIRNCITEMIGYIIINIFSNESNEIFKDKSDKINSKKKFVNLLFKRLYDGNSFCRNKVLKTFIYLSSNNALELEEYFNLLNESILRTKDENVYVRKKALSLIEQLVQNFMKILGGKKLMSIEKIEEEIKVNKENKNLIDIFEKLKRFIIIIQNLIDFLVSNLHSRLKIEILSSMDLIENLTSYGVEKALNVGMVNLLPLIFSSDEDIKAKVRSIFYEIFFDNKDYKKQYSEIINFCNLLDYSERNCFEKILSYLLKEHKIDDKLVNIILTEMLKLNPSSVEGKIDLWLICTIAYSDNNILLNNYVVFIKKINLELTIQKLNIDNEWVQLAVKGILILYENSNKINQKEKTENIKKNAVITLWNIIKLMIMFILNEEDKTKSQWFSMAHEILNTILIISPSPENIYSNILRYIISNSQLKSTYAKSQLLFLLGHISMNLLILIEQMQINIQEDNEKENLIKNKEGKICTEEEMAKEEIILIKTEKIKNLFQENYLYKNLMSLFIPIIKEVSYSNLISTNVLFQKSAVFSLMKFMCCDENFCKENISHILTDLNSHFKSNNYGKLNISIAFADFACRFPNITANYITNYFNCLRDNNSSNILKHYIMLMISHLVLNDMLKIREQIVDICFILEETNDIQLKNIIFFLLSELNKKGNNIIYNIFPNAINRLIKEYKNENYERIKKVIKILLMFISKQKQIENILEKLYNILISSEDIFEWEIVSFCLTEIKFDSEYASKFCELYSLHKDKIEIDKNVKENFEIIKKRIKTNEKKYYNNNKVKDLKEIKEEKIIGKKRNRSNIKKLSKILKI